jgi:hypothetical protein
VGLAAVLAVAVWSVAALALVGMDPGLAMDAVRRTMKQEMPVSAD